jgi:hypothetical protein
MAWVDDNVYAHATIDRICAAIASHRAVAVRDEATPTPVGA